MPSATGARRPAGSDRSVVDLRLVLPALIAWATLAAALGRSALEQVEVAGGAVLIAAICGAVARRRRGPWRTLVLSFLVVAGVLATAAGHQAVRTTGPIPDTAARHGHVRLEGVVDSDPRRLPADAEHPRARTVVRLLVRSVATSGVTTPVRTPVLLVAGGTAGDDLAHVHWWDRLEVAGRASSADRGEDVEAVVIVTGHPKVLAPAGPLGAFTEHVRARMRAAVEPLPSDAAGLVPALVLGDRSLTPADLTDDMTATGMSHLSAVSGSNTTLVLGAVMLVLGACGCPRRWRCLW